CPQRRMSTRPRPTRRSSRARSHAGAKSYARTTSSPWTDLNQFLGAEQQRIRNANSQALRRRAIDHQIEVRRLHEWQRCRIRAVEDLVDKSRREPEVLDLVVSIAQQAAGLGIFL